MDIRRDGIILGSSGRKHIIEGIGDDRGLPQVVHTGSPVVTSLYIGKIENHAGNE